MPMIVFSAKTEEEQAKLAIEAVRVRYSQKYPQPATVTLKDNEGRLYEHAVIPMPGGVLNDKEVQHLMNTLQDIEDVVDAMYTLRGTSQPASAKRFH